MQPLLSDEEYELLVEQAEQFKLKEGRQLQRVLWLKYLWSTNYISDWWENYVYLRSRPPLMINSNFYIMDSHGAPPTTIQTARAAGLLHLLLRFKQRLDLEQLEPMLLGRMVPLCMSQYERLFSTTRRPGKEGDVLKHWAPGARGLGVEEQYKHIVVLRNGYFFRLQVELRSAHGTSPIPSAAELEEMIQRLVDQADKLPPAPEAEAAIPAFTSIERSRWAAIREHGFGDGVNKKSLEIVEKAICVLNLDKRAPTEWTEIGATLLHGGGEPGIWYDKSFNLVVFANGHAGLNAEHSWADALVAAHLWEYALTGEALGPAGETALGLAAGKPKKEQHGEGGEGGAKCRSIYDESGHCRKVEAPTAETEREEDGGDSDSDGDGDDDDDDGDYGVDGTAASLASTRMVPSKYLDMYLDTIDRSPRRKKKVPFQQKAVRLLWELEADVKLAALSASAEAKSRAEDLQLVVEEYTAFGKGFMKKARVSPDAWVQMALQLAFYRDQGKFELTYESAMVRLFCKGRTETVRPCTVHSRAFVLAMCGEGEGELGASKAKTAAERREVKQRLLRVAADQHQLGNRDAMSGKGADRHLFGLFVLSMGLKIDSPFLKQALSRQWKLSTSQQPQKQDPERWSALEKAGVNTKEIFSPGGGFGPVADDGYGVSYMLAGEDSVYFHISAKNKAPNSDALSFKKHLFAAFDDMHALFEG